jgi:NADPH:quinone reductase-like Zn-dependent oxidoreductase
VRQMQSPRGTKKVPETAAQALWYAGPGRAEIRPEPVGEPGPGEVQVRALHSGVSRGTERLVLAGQVPPSEFQRMRAPFMAGAFSFPVKYGYSAVGRVERGPTKLEGRVVFALHPHQNLFNVPAEAVALVPDPVPPARAVLAANMETALNAVWDAQPAAADRVAIVGAGVVGSLVAWLCAQLPAAQVTLVDVEASRGELARRLGVGFAAPDTAQRDCADCDLVVHASGTTAGLATALNLAGMEATVLELSWYGTQEVAAPLGGAFHSRRLKLISSQVGQVAASHRARWNFKRRLDAALQLLSDPRLDELLAPPIKFQDLPSRLPDILKPRSGVLCQIVDY